MSYIAFIGAGNMGGALVRGACRAISPADVVIYRPTAAAAEALAAETGCRTAQSGAAAAKGARYVVLCVKPQIICPVLEDLLPALRESVESGLRPVVVSIAAAVQLDVIEQVLSAGGLELPVVRVMPNTPSAIGKGVLLTAPGDGVSEEEYAGLEQVLSGCGLVERVSESELDLGSTVAGCGPAFVYLFIEGLADGGVQIGLPRDKAQKWAAEMVTGAAEMVLRTGAHPGVLKDAVCSPGGTTIEGVAALEARGFRSAAAQAVAAAWKKTCDLGK